jgi:multicomponent Na+:H+ antiporter subunit E
MPAKLRAAAGRGLAFAGLWWVLAEGNLYGWAFGLLLAAAATAASLSLVPPSSWRHRWGRLPRFLIFFARQAFLGGLDVALRALHPRMPLRPGFIGYRPTLPAGLPRLYLAWAVSLLPGTVSVRLTDDRLEIHVLDQALPIHDSLAALEARIAALVEASRR